MQTNKYTDLLSTIKTEYSQGVFTTILNELSKVVVRPNDFKRHSIFKRMIQQLCEAPDTLGKKMNIKENHYCLIESFKKIITTVIEKNLDSEYVIVSIFYPNFTIQYQYQHYLQMLSKKGYYIYYKPYIVHNQNIIDGVIDVVLDNDTIDFKQKNIIKDGKILKEPTNISFKYKVETGQYGNYNKYYNEIDNLKNHQFYASFSLKNLKTGNIIEKRAMQFEYSFFEERAKKIKTFDIWKEFPSKWFEKTMLYGLIAWAKAQIPELYDVQSEMNLEEMELSRLENDDLYEDKTNKFNQESIENKPMEMQNKYTTLAFDKREKHIDNQEFMKTIFENQKNLNQSETEERFLDLMHSIKRIIQEAKKEYTENDVKAIREIFGSDNAKILALSIAFEVKKNEVQDGDGVVTPVYLYQDENSESFQNIKDSFKEYCDEYFAFYEKAKIIIRSFKK